MTARRINQFCHVRRNLFRFGYEISNAIVAFSIEFYVFLRCKKSTGEKNSVKSRVDLVDLYGRCAFGAATQFSIDNLMILSWITYPPATHISLMRCCYPLRMMNE